MLGETPCHHRVDRRFAGRESLLPDYLGSQVVFGGHAGVVQHRLHPLRRRGHNRQPVGQAVVKVVVLSRAPIVETMRGHVVKHSLVVEW